MRKSTRRWGAVAVVTLLLPVTVLAADLTTVPAETLTQHLNDNTLRKGDRGNAVAQLQDMLRKAGFDPGPIDGIFGPATEAAVRRAQAVVGLQADGVASRAVVARLAKDGGKVPDKAAAPQMPSQRLIVHQATGSTDAATVPATAPTLPTATDLPSPATTTAASTRPPAARPQLVGLTFNGDLDPRWTPRVLAILERNGMKATFFVTGESAAKQPALIHAIVEAGHDVASNGWDGQPMTQLPSKEMQKQLLASQRAIADLTGKVPVFFRPPQGRFNPTLTDSASAVGLRTVLWTNVNVKDLPDLPMSALADRLTGSAYPGAVVMLHQDRPTTVNALETILSSLRKRGFHSVTLSRLLGTS